MTLSRYRYTVTVTEVLTDLFQEKYPKLSQKYPILPADLSGLYGRQRGVLQKNSTLTKFTFRLFFDKCK
jgi:hypothetical protein